MHDLASTHFEYSMRVYWREHLIQKRRYTIWCSCFQRCTCCLCRSFPEHHRRKSAKKGFFCKVIGARMQCLGKSKGRSYAPMKKVARLHLNEFYAKPNQELRGVLRFLGVRFPDWLHDMALLNRRQDKHSMQ